MKFYVKTRLSENISETREGFLLCRNVPLTHTGRLRYNKGEHPFEDREELFFRRTPETLFSDVTIGSFVGKPITIEHPAEFVSPNTYKELNNGVILNPRKLPDQIEVEGELVDVLGADFLIMSKEAIQLVKSGVREVSLGYDAVWELDDESDEGEHTKLIGNHCAIVENGRAGIECAINDHKGVNTMDIKKLKEQYRKLFGKSLDEAMKDKEEEKKKKAKDAEEAARKKKEEEEAGDIEAGPMTIESLAERVGLIEESVAKIVAAVSKEETVDEEADVVVDEEEEVVVEDEEEESEDAEEDAEEGEKQANSSLKKTKDSAAVRTELLSQAEILVPGIKASKNIVKETLEKFYATTDGKKVLDKFTGGRHPSKLHAQTQKAFFVAASEMVKAKRATDTNSVKFTSGLDSFDNNLRTEMTPEKLNEMNKKHYTK